MKDSKKIAIKEIIKTTKPDIFSEPKNIKFLKDLVNDSCSYSKVGFCLIKSLNNLFYIVYVSDSNNIIFYDLKNEQLISIIKDAHSQYIDIIKYFQDKKNQKDILLTSSSDAVKLWNLNNLENFCSFDFSEKSNLKIKQSCFLHFNNDINIVIKLTKLDKTEEFIQIYNLKKEKIKEIKDKNTKDDSYFLDCYYHNNISYLISCSFNSIKVYNYNKNKWKIYSTDKINECIQGFAITNIDNGAKMIGSSMDNIYLWNFQSGALLNSIKGGSNRAPFFALCLWNIDSFFIGRGGVLDLVKIKNNKLNVVKRLSEHNELIPCIKKILHPIYGECLISQDFKGIIKLWVNKNK